MKDSKAEIYGEYNFHDAKWNLRDLLVNPEHARAYTIGLQKVFKKSNYNLLQDSLNIDDLVDPRMTTVSRIMEHVHKGSIGTVYSLLDGEYEFIEAKISEKSELVNKKIRDANLPEDIRIGAIIRKEKVIIPRSNFIFEKNDLVVFLVKREELKAVEDIFSVGSI